MKEKMLPTRVAMVSPGQTRVRIQNAMVLLASVAAVACLALLLVYWTWILIAPDTEKATTSAAENSVTVDAAYTLFGNAQTAVNPAMTGIAIRLIGIVASAVGHDGYAVVQIDAKKILALRAGDELAPGIRLLEVGTDRLVLERGGIRETLLWPVNEGSKKGINVTSLSSTM